MTGISRTWTVGFPPTRTLVADGPGPGRAAGEATGEGTGDVGTDDAGTEDAIGGVVAVSSELARAATGLLEPEGIGSSAARFRVATSTPKAEANKTPAPIARKTRRLVGRVSMTGFAASTEMLDD